MSESLALDYKLSEFCDDAFYKSTYYFDFVSFVEGNALKTESEIITDRI